MPWNVATQPHTPHPLLLLPLILLLLHHIHFSTSREISTKVTSKQWPTTPYSPICEAHGYWQAYTSSRRNHDHDREMEMDAQFIRLVTDANRSLETYEDGMNLALDVSREMLDVDGELFLWKFLKYSLSMREFAPACEMMRKVVRQNMNDGGGNDSIGGSVTAFVQLYMYCHGTLDGVVSKVTSHIDEVQRFMMNVCVGQGAGVEYGVEPVILEGEQKIRVGGPRLSDGGDLHRPYAVVILNGNVGKEDFNLLYETVIASDIPIDLIVRHMGDAYFEDRSDGTCAPDSIQIYETALQGYGVRLDIKNTEYSTFDNETITSLQQNDFERQEERIGGIDVAKLADRADSRSSPHLNTLEDLIKESVNEIVTHDFDVPSWKIRSLPLQAASAIVTSDDVLWKLRDVSQNLPSRLSHLVDIEVSQSLQADATYVQEKFKGEGSYLFVNKREIDISHATFNIFQLLQTIRHEQAAMMDLHEELYFLPSGHAKQVVVEALMTKKQNQNIEKTVGDTPVRFDVARGGKGAVFYVNNIETDAEYGSWPTSLRSLLYSMQGGGAPTVRRNVFTALLVIDPTNPDHFSHVETMIRLLYSNIPVRVGLLVLSGSDLESCIKDGEKWGSQPSDLKGLTASHLLTILNHASQHGPMLTFNVLLMAKDFIKGANASKNSLDHFLSNYARIFVSVYPRLVQADIIREVKNMFSSEEMQERYGASVKFAVQKGVVPGMSFLNGRLLSSNGGSIQDSVMSVLQEEQTLIAMSLMNGDINDRRPRSLYLSFLKGKNVYEKYHSILAKNSDEERYIKIPVHTRIPDFSLNVESELVFIVDIFLSQDSIGSGKLEHFLERAAALQSLNVEGDECGVKLWIHSLPNGSDGDEFISINGRRYVPRFMDQISFADVEFIASTEIDRSRNFKQLLQPHLEDKNNLFDAVARLVSFTGRQTPSSKDASTLEILQNLNNLDLDSNELYRKWNNEVYQQSTKPKITAVVDPLSESTQRLSSVLLSLRDHLDLPVEVLFLTTPLTSKHDLPLKTYYRFLADVYEPEKNNHVVFTDMPEEVVLTMRMDVPEPWVIQQTVADEDADNIRCQSTRCQSINVEYDLKSLLFFGQCYDVKSGSPPNGLQLTLTDVNENNRDISDTVVMKTLGYWQLQANAGVFDLKLTDGSRGDYLFDIVKDESLKSQDLKTIDSKLLVMKDFTSTYEKLFVTKKSGMERFDLLNSDMDDIDAQRSVQVGDNQNEEETIHVFSLATGHAYERLLRIMMLSVTKRASTKVKFWLFENFLSPSFKASAAKLSEKLGFELEYVTYKWPEWLRSQSEKQRIIWGYKILFLDVLFPLSVTKIIYVDADQVMRADLLELMKLDLGEAAYGYTPFCDTRSSTLGFQFWREGYWKNLLQGKSYHISALYVVDLARFRRQAVGDALRATYQSLSADPMSLANLDQDLPNYAQSLGVEIFSLPQDWLWCETWCSDETKATAKTIDLCNNPLHKEPKISMAKRIISGDLFSESWEELDKEVELLTA